MCTSKHLTFMLSIEYLRLKMSRCFILLFIIKIINELRYLELNLKYNKINLNKIDFQEVYIYIINLFLFLPSFNKFGNIELIFSLLLCYTNFNNNKNICIVTLRAACFLSDIILIALEMFDTRTCPFLPSNLASLLYF